jgi:hypothetical protein
VRKRASPVTSIFGYYYSQGRARRPAGTSGMADRVARREWERCCYSPDRLVPLAEAPHSPHSFESRVHRRAGRRRRHARMQLRGDLRGRGRCRDTRSGRGRCLGRRSTRRDRRVLRPDALLRSRGPRRRLVPGAHLPDDLSDGVRTAHLIERQSARSGREHPHTSQDPQIAMSQRSLCLLVLSACASASSHGAGAPDAGAETASSSSSCSR